MIAVHKISQKKWICNRQRMTGNRKCYTFTKKSNESHGEHYMNVSNSDIIEGQWTD